MDAHYTLTRQCIVYPYEVPGFFAAEIFGDGILYPDVLCLSRDPVRAEGMAWEKWGINMIKRTRTLAYQSIHEGPNGYVP